MPAIETWILLTLMAYLFYAVSTTIDKYMMINKMHPLNTNTIKMVMNAVVVFILFSLMFSPSFFMSLFQLGLLITMGLVYAATGTFYFKAFQLNEMTKMVPYIPVNSGGADIHRFCHPTL